MSEAFGKRLRELRNEQHLTQAQLAQIFNVSKMTVSAWETNKQEPCIEDIKKLADVFDTSTDYLLCHKENI